MLSNYFKIAIRSLSKNYVFTGLNIVGLAIGLAIGMLVLLWVKDELSFDNYHPDVAQIYRAHTNVKLSDRMLVLETCPAPHAAYALREIPEVGKAVRVVEADEALVSYGPVSFVESAGAFVDTAFFDMFKVGLIAGNAGQVFSGTNSLVINESFARKYFGDKDNIAAVIGKVINIDQEPLQVTAVIKDFPGNTHLKYDYFRPYEYLKVAFQPNELWKSREEDWGNCSDATYYKLSPNADVAGVAHKLGELTHTHNKLDRGTFYTLQSLSSIHLIAPDGSESGMLRVRIFSLIAFFILLIACINYINLATAKASKRALEVGVRKAIGAGRGQLIAQFLVESCLVFFMASALALGLANLLLPFCNELADKQLSFNWQDPSIPLFMAAVLGVALLLSAVYPALVLSAFSPIRALKSQFNTGNDRQAKLRKGLIVVQFACSSALLLAMFVIGRQMDFIKTNALGYDRENVFQIELSEASYQNRVAFMEALKASPGVLSVTAASGNILHNRIRTGDTEWDGSAEQPRMMIAPMAVAPNYLDFFNMPLMSGTGFSGTPADSSAFIVNETAVKQMGISDPIGKRFKLWETEGRIVGVVKDFHFSSLHTAIMPAIFYANAARQNLLCVKTSTKAASQAIASAADIWKRFDSAYPFEYAFMDEAFDNMYRKEQRSNAMFQAFSLFALLISCLGLFGLSAFTVEQRSKEIGIRKILGASVPGIASLLAKDFLGLVLLAFLLASPIAYWGLNLWLTDFAYRIELQWWMFALAGFMALSIAFLTISFQSFRAAFANPVDSLRSE